MFLNASGSGGINDGGRFCKPAKSAGSENIGRHWSTPSDVSGSCCGSSLSFVAESVPLVFMALFTSQSSSDGSLSPLDRFLDLLAATKNRNWNEINFYN